MTDAVEAWMREGIEAALDMRRARDEEPATQAELLRDARSAQA